MAIKEGGVQQILVDTPKVEGLNCEGSHFHKINGHYYLLLIQWPKTGTGRRIQWCYRCDNLLGEYTGRIILDDDLGYRNNGVAQGGLFQAGGNWYAMLFQDRDTVGRCPVLIPVRWADGWPVPGENGKPPMELTVPFAPRPAAPFTESDEFNYSENRLSHIWQWNHNPDNAGWSVTERPGWLRLKNRHCSQGFERARNTLTQRAVGPCCTFATRLDTSGMLNGDCAGLAALQYHFGYVGVCVDGHGKHLVMCTGDGEQEHRAASVPLGQDEVFLMVRFEFTGGKDMAGFYFSLDNQAWQQIGEPLSMVYKLEHFTGYRPALFSYPTKTAGGFADFDYLRFEP